MARLSSIFTAALAAFGTAAASAVVDLIPDNFDDVVLRSGKPALVEFFAPWCGHCKNLAPVYEELATNFESQKDKVTIAKVDADAHRDLGLRFGVQGFPTLKWFDGKSDEPQDYSSGRDIDSLTTFVSDKLGVKAKAKKAVASAVEMLNDSSFEKLVGVDKDVLVAFTAPWCGHCKSLAPTWEKLATDFASEAGVLVAKVDCEAENAKAIAQRFGIKSYPTINYFPKGSVDAVPYTGGRTEGDLISFLNEKAGTFRAAGGSLNDLAGVIPSLDTVVANLRTGGDKAYSEFVKTVGKAKDKYSEYYAKVGKKLQDNQAYAEKELKRVQGLIKKGGLAPEKLDDLISRSNILAKFQADDTKSEL